MRPSKFFFAIGGFHGPWKEYRLEDGGLRYMVNAGGCPPHILEDRGASLVVAEKKMTDSDWLKFWDALDAKGCDIWSWHKKYFDPLIMDGTQWEIKIRLGNKYAFCDGCNEYPGGNSKGSEFNKFIEVLGGVLSIEDDELPG